MWRSQWRQQDDLPGYVWQNWARMVRGLNEAGVPLMVGTDLLQNVKALVALGYGADRRLKRALELIREKKDARGRWAMGPDFLYSSHTP